MWSISEISRQECVLITNLTFPPCFILRVMCFHYYHMYGKKRRPNKLKSFKGLKKKNSIAFIEQALFCISVKEQQSIFLASD